MSDAVKPAKTKAMLLLIVSLFVLPMLVALAMHHFSLRPGVASHGALIDPPRPLQFPPMLTWQRQQFSGAELRGHWSLLYAAPEGCGEQCAGQAHMLRQVQASLGKHSAKVRCLLLVAGVADASRLDAVQRNFPDLVILSAPAESAARLVGLLAAPGRSPEGAYLIDPAGNAMMRYAPGTDPGGMRKDLMRVLDNSRTE